MNYNNLLDLTYDYISNVDKNPNSAVDGYLLEVWNEGFRVQKSWYFIGRVCCIYQSQGVESNSLNISFLDQNLRQWWGCILPGDQSQPTQINLGHARRWNGECFWNSIWKFSNLCIWYGLLEKFFIHPLGFLLINLDSIHFIQREREKALTLSNTIKSGSQYPPQVITPPPLAYEGPGCEIFTGSQPHTSPVRPVSASNFIADQSLLKLFKHDERIIKVLAPLHPKRW